MIVYANFTSIKKKKKQNLQPRNKSRINIWFPKGSKKNKNKNKLECDLKQIKCMKIQPYQTQKNNKIIILFTKLWNSTLPF